MNDRLAWKERRKGVRQIESVRERERESARARKREGSVVGRAVLRKRRRSRRGKLALVTAMGVPLLDSCEVKSLPWF